VVPGFLSLLGSVDLNEVLELSLRNVARAFGTSRAQEFKERVVTGEWLPPLPAAPGLGRLEWD
jgi:hypothetical protein